MSEENKAADTQKTRWYESPPFAVALVVIMVFGSIWFSDVFKERYIARQTEKLAKINADPKAWVMAEYPRSKVETVLGSLDRKAKKLCKIAKEYADKDAPVFKAYVREATKTVAVLDELSKEIQASYCREQCGETLGMRFKGTLGNVPFEGTARPERR